MESEPSSASWHRFSLFGRDGLKSIDADDDIHVVPVLLGDGVRLFGATFGPVALERTLIATSGRVIDLRFAVNR